MARLHPHTQDCCRAETVDLCICLLVVICARVPYKRSKTLDVMTCFLVSSPQYLSHLGHICYADPRPHLD